MNYVLGIDGGGSKTVCVLMNEARQVLGRGEAGPSNYQSIGIAATLQSIKDAIDEAIKTTNNVNISAICLGLAGVGRTEDIEIIKKLVQELPINWELQPENIVICNDALIALMGGIGHDVGIVVAAGTGSIVFGRNHQKKTKRVGGWGYILGDEGSAYKIAVAGMQAALKSYDGREISTTLVEDFKQHLSLASIEDLIELIYRREWGVKEIAALAPVVDFAAASGDEIANQIIDDSVKELVKATATVIEAIFNSESVLEVVTTGSVWLGRCKIQERFAASIIKNFSFVRVIYPRYEPAIGAGLLALQRL
ncbi:putative N-acetylglucosamine kinase [Cylindrospermum stagnale PCC 7417]|uniref:Putative N-acetylglucosamine kinase n=1 Tax=Cylindrospermum stagnale PCC 7417 TaxID=56107 RepID=K9WX54_9NOST|nr:N-acetylglucosamine kinase [Cylindrospermum stagnale]AFZ24399.1 putative N-acetylglucosamine kinase [Cylindrospermum stagnale PCC 7417]